MTVGAVPEDKKVVFDNLDMVRDRQESNGTFSHENFNFYYGFAYEDDPSFVYTEQYFAAAFCLIPVVRFRKFMDGRYDNFIEKGFRFLNKKENRLQVMRHGLSPAAYVYALNNQPEEAQNLLREIEKAYIHLEDNKKCYKIFEIDIECDVRHTSYVALTYLTLNDMIKAEPIIFYLSSLKPAFGYWQNTRFLSIVTEPIAEMGVMLNVKNTNLKINVKNEHAFSKDLYIDDGNSDRPQTVEIPQGSEQVSSVISGQGFCTISVIFERIVVVPVVENVFSLTVKTKVGIPSSMRIVEVCATYNQQSGMKPVLVNVVYEVEMPSGYIFLSHTETGSNINKIKVRNLVFCMIIEYFRENLIICLNNLLFSVIF